MMKQFKYTIRLVASLFIIVVMATACLENTFEEKEKDEQAKIDECVSRYDLSGYKLGNGIYLKFLFDTTSESSPKPVTGNSVLVRFTGRYSDETIFETTDSVEGASLFSDRYFVYGPTRLKVGNLIYGFDTTLRYMSPGDSAIMLIPSKYMWYDYEPVVYNVKLLKIIPNDSTYESDVFRNFFTKNNYDKKNYIGINSNKDTLYYKVVVSNTPGSLSKVPIEISGSDSVIINLWAYYAECYYPDNTGRLFFPLTSSYSQKLSYKWGSGSYFPIVPAIDSAIKHMAPGDILSICGKASWGYGDEGFSDPYQNIVAVPPATSVNYRIQLIGHRKSDGVWEY
jgi:hypothetical protein